MEQKAVQLQVPVGDIRIGSAQGGHGSLPVGVGEVPVIRIHGGSAAHVGELDLVEAETVHRSGDEHIARGNAVLKHLGGVGGEAAGLGLAVLTHRHGHRTVHGGGTAGVGNRNLQGSLFGSRELEVTVHVAGLAAELDEGGVVLALGAGVEQKAVQLQVPIGDIRVGSAQGGHGSLPVGVGEVPGEGYLHLLFTALGLDGEGGASQFGILVVDVSLARQGLHGEAVQAGLQFGDILGRNGEGKPGLRILCTFVEDDPIGGGIVNGIPADGDIGRLAFLEGNGLDDGFRGFQHPVAGQDILAPGQEVDGNGTGGIEVDGTFARHLGNHDFLDVRIGGGCHGTTLHNQAVVIVEGHDDGGTRLIRINQQHVHGSGLVHLEGSVSLGGNAFAGKDGSGGEVDGAIGVERRSFGTHEHEQVTHTGVLHVTGEKAGILKIPGMRLGHHLLGEVFGLLHIGNPPLGRTHLGLDEVLGCQLEEVALGIVARVHVHGNESGGGGGHLGEEVFTVGITVVPGSGAEGRFYRIGVVLEQLGAVGPVGLASVFEKEEVVLERHLMRDANGEDTAVVAVIDGGDVLHGVVLEIDVADLDGIGSVDTEQGADTVIQGVVHKGDFVDFRGLADIHGITAGTGDTVHVAGIELEGSDLHHIVVVSIEETGQEVGDFAMEEHNAVQNGRAAGVFHDSGAGHAVKLDVLEVEVGTGFGEVCGEFHLALYHGLGAVGAQFTHEGEAGGRFGGAHGIRRIAVSEVEIATGGNGGLQFVGSGDGDGCTLFGLGEDIQGTAGCAHVEEGHLVLGGSGEAADGSGGGAGLGRTDFMLHRAAALDGNGLNFGHFFEVGHILAPGQGDGGLRATGDFRI